MIFEFKKTPKGYAVTGRKTPCSSKKRLMTYILWELYKMKLDEGTIIIKGEE